MSAPSHYAQEAEQIKYGFLAAKSKHAIGKLLENQELTNEDREILFQAKEYLQKLSAEVKSVSEGTHSGYSSQESMIALRIAMDPLRTLKQVLEDKIVHEYFLHLLNALPTPNESRTHLSPERIQRLNDAAQFFSALYISLLRAISDKGHSTNLPADIPSF